MKDVLKEIERKTLDDCIPIRAVVELTYRCNFSCVHCYCVPSPDRRELSGERIKDILRQLAAAGALVLTFTGGDVSARPDFWDIARYARELRFALRWFTNGSEWDEESARKARDLHPLSVDISLYGSRPEVYEAVTGDGAHFFRVLSGIRNLKAQGVPVTLKLPVLEENYDDLPGMVRLCGELGLPYVMGADITPRDDGSPAPLEHAISCSRRREFLARYEKPLSRGRRRPGDYLCNTARNTAVISPYGDVFPCVQIKESAGSLLENDFRDIWRGSPLLDRLRRMRVRDLEGCSGCGYLNWCSYCPGISLREKGRFEAVDHRACEWARLRAELGLVCH